jgi:hypothetical protein
MIGVCRGIKLAGAAVAAEDQAHGSPSETWCARGVMAKMQPLQFGAIRG